MQYIESLFTLSDEALETLICKKVGGTPRSLRPLQSHDDCITLAKPFTQTKQWRVLVKEGIAYGMSPCGKMVRSYCVSWLKAGKEVAAVDDTNINKAFILSLLIALEEQKNIA